MGNMDAFQELVGRYSARIVSFLTRFVHDYDRALDLAQETFLRLFLRIRGQNPGSNPVGSCTALVFTIASNLGKDELRRRAVRREVSIVGDLQLRTATKDNPAAVAEKKEEYAQVMRALEKLDPNTKALLIWREIDGMSYDDISRISGLRLGTVKSRLNRARIAFKNSYLRMGKT